MIIDYKKDNTFTISSDKEGLEGLRLISGNNEISGEKWAKYKNHPSIINLLKLEKIKVHGDQNDENNAMKTLKDFSPDEAKKIVAKTNNLKNLEAWEKIEKREGVLAVIKKQLKELLKQPEKPAEK